MTIKNPYWPRISTGLYYADPAAAIDFLVKAFGFAVRLRIDGPDNQVIHSELTLGDDGLIMVGGLRQAEVAKSWHQTPRAIDGHNTQSLMVHVDDVEAHCQRARAAGATITQEPKLHDYGEEYWLDRCYEAVDPEGHRWFFAQRIRDQPEQK